MSSHDSSICEFISWLMFLCENKSYVVINTVVCMCGALDKLGHWTVCDIGQTGKMDYKKCQAFGKFFHSTLLQFYE